MSNSIQPQFIFHEKNNTVNITDFSPRTTDALSNFLKFHLGKVIFYLQKVKEGFSAGKLYSYILYSPSIKFYPRQSKIDPRFSIEEGSALKRMEQVKDLALKNNQDEVIFPSEMLERFDENTNLIENKGFCFQVFEKDRLVAHASVVKVSDAIFNHAEIYVILRLVVDEPYRKFNLQDTLMEKIAEKIPAGSPVYLQVFPHNERALKFFLRRMNVTIHFEKWKLHNK